MAAVARSGWGRGGGSVSRTGPLLCTCAFSSNGAFLATRSPLFSLLDVLPVPARDGLQVSLGHLNWEDIDRSRALLWVEGFLLSFFPSFP